MVAKPQACAARWNFNHLARIPDSLPCMAHSSRNDGQKKEEFRQLRQGQTTVDEYHRKFLELSRYAGKDVATDVRTQEKFREGLQLDIELTLSLFDCADFATLVSKAFQAETALTKHRESLKRARDAGPSLGRPVQKARVWLPHNVFHRPAPTPRPSYVALRLPPPPRQLSIQTRQPGHPAPDCRPVQTQNAPCPPAGPNKSCRNRCLRNRNAKHSAVILGRVNHVDAEKAQKDPTIMMGTLPINSVPASVLFDSGSSHSFMSKAFAHKQGWSFDEMYPPLVFSSPGSRWETTLISHKNHM